MARSACAPLAALVLLAAAAPAPAQVVSYNFDNQSDAGLTRYNPLGNGAFTFPQVTPPAAGNFGYRLQAGASPNPATFGPGRVASARTDVTLTDSQAAVDVTGFNAALGQAFGPALRGRQLGPGTTDGYALFYFPQSAAGTPVILLNRLDNEFGTPIGSPAAVTLDPARRYRMALTAVGALLTGQVFDLSNPTAPLATVTATDATYASGFPGLIAAASLATPTSTADVTFDNFTAQPIPEPGSLALVGLGLAGGVLAERRRRSRRA